MNSPDIKVSSDNSDGQSGRYRYFRGSGSDSKATLRKYMLSRMRTTCVTGVYSPKGKYISTLELEQLKKKIKCGGLKSKWELLAQTKFKQRQEELRLEQKNFNADCAWIGIWRKPLTTNHQHKRWKVNDNKIVQFFITKFRGHMRTG